MHLAVQYAQDGAAASDIFRRLGEAMLEDGRPGRRWNPLRLITWARRPSSSGLFLTRAFVRRQRFVALACVHEARLVGVPDADMVEEIREIEQSLGTALSAAWRGLVIAANR